MGTKEEAECHVINLGNKDPVTVSYLVDCIEAALGKKAIRNYMPMPPTGDVLKTNADVTMAAQEFGYAPTTPLKEGIEMFIKWYKEYYKNGMDQERPIMFRCEAEFACACSTGVGWLPAM